MTLSDLLQVPDAVTIGLHPDLESKASELLDRCVQAALERFLCVRREEGERLSRQFLKTAGELAEYVLEARSLQKKQVAEMRRRILERTEELRSELDPERIEQEIALLAEKADVEEEIVRLNAHLEALGQLLSGPEGGAGKRMDHLFQEMQRETSTLLAKSRLLELTKIGMEIRLRVEQMREQVQNVA